ncbi:MAG: sigma-54 dependent transcriptional regulator [Bacteroidota bacterium]
MALEEARLWVVDDDDAVLHTARLFLRQFFTEVRGLTHPDGIPALLEETTPEVVLLDMNFRPGDTDGKEGLRWLRELKKRSSNTSVVLTTAYGDVGLAVEGLKEGASDFVEKPWKNEKLLATVRAALDLHRNRQEVDRLRDRQEQVQADNHGAFQDFIGESPAMQRVKALIEKVAPTDANVLILGENGTGKEVVAHALHQHSLRAKEILMGVDLGAIQDSLFESELFGHVKGAFTDARQDRPGRFETASGGTLFLDEIGNLTPALQSKLLSVLQNRQVTRVGANKPKEIDVRLVCATNMPLYEMVEEQTFRQDLMYRINTVEIVLPPLRERREDIPLLLKHFMRSYAKKYKKGKMVLSSDAEKMLVDYPWPGNVRELQHAVERAVILAEGEILTQQDFGLRATENEPQQSFDVELTLEEMEGVYIRHMLDRNHGNVSQTAKNLGLTRTAMYRRLHKHGIISEDE